MASPGSYAQYCGINKTFIINGGKYEFAGPYADRVTVTTLAPRFGTYATIDTIQDESVSDAIATSSACYVATTTHLTKYESLCCGNPARRLAQADTLDGINSLLYIPASNTHGIIIAATRAFGTPAGGARLVLFNDSLSTRTYVTGIPDEADGLAVIGDSLFVSVPGSWGTVGGKLAIVNLATRRLSRIIDLGTNATSIGKLFTSPALPGKVISVNALEFGSSTGAITIYNSADGSFEHKLLPHPVGDGIGVINNLLYARFSASGFGVYDLSTARMINPVLFNRPFAAATITAESEDKYFTATSQDYISNGKAWRISRSGLVTDSFEVGTSPEAVVASQFECTTGIEQLAESKPELEISPNPADDFIRVSYNGFAPLANTYKISDLSGKTVLTGFISTANPELNIRALQAGMYILQVNGAKGTASEMLIRK
ncbi:MAG: T9SS type A sorting domain-containing protein [Bacteroidota bacterium]